MKKLSDTYTKGHTFDLTQPETLPAQGILDFSGLPAGQLPTAVPTSAGALGPSNQTSPFPYFYYYSPSPFTTTSTGIFTGISCPGANVEAMPAQMEILFDKLVAAVHKLGLKHGRDCSPMGKCTCGADALMREVAEYVEEVDDLDSQP